MQARRVSCPRTSRLWRLWSTRRRQIELTVALGCLLAACLACATSSGSGGLPSWARHIEPPAVSPTATTSSLTAKLIQELASPELGPGSVAPEQIAVLAINEARARRDWDAALLLSLASDRYRRVAMRARKLWFASAMERAGTINVTAYGKVLEREVGVYRDLDFDDEIGSAAARASGQTQQAQVVVASLADMMKAQESQREEMRKDLVAKLSQMQELQKESLHYPDLAQAYLARLIADVKSSEIRSFAMFYLATTPLRAFRLAALDNAVELFEPALCKALAAQWRGYRAELIRALHSPRSETRANAAATLGLADSEENLADLEGVMATETNPAVKRALLYALIRLGKTEQLELLASGLRDSEIKTREQTVMLLQWLPGATEAKLDQGVLASLLANQSERRIRMFAAAILGDIAATTTLTSAAVDALLAASAGTEAQLASKTKTTIAGLKQLDHAQVMGLLRTRSASKIALLRRLAKVAIPEDLPWLSRALDGSTDEDEREVIVQAAAAIPGQSALTSIAGWYRNHEKLRTSLISGFLARPDSERQTLLALTREIPGSASLLYRLAVKDPGATEIARETLRTGDISARAGAARMAGIVKLEACVPELWNLVGYTDNEYYPADAILRHSSLVSILDMVLAK